MAKKMAVLIACEESQAISTEFRKLGHEAYSCDIQDCSGGHPEWHIKGDVLGILEPTWTWSRLYNDYLIPSDEPAIKTIQFETMDGTWHEVDHWDLIIAHPPCTDLAVSGARHFERKRMDGRQRKSIEFFCKFLQITTCPVVIENPVCIISGKYIPKWFPDLAEKYSLPLKPTQIIQPYWFGNHARKTTCLWIRGNLNPLVPTNVVDPGAIVGKGFSVGASLDMARDENGKILAWNDPRTAKARSKTFPGIAKAMAEQWGGLVG